MSTIIFYAVCLFILEVFTKAGFKAGMSLILFIFCIVFVLEWLKGR